MVRNSQRLVCSSCELWYEASVALVGIFYGLCYVALMAYVTMFLWTIVRGPMAMVRSSYGLWYVAAVDYSSMCLLWTMVRTARVDYSTYLS